MKKVLFSALVLGAMTLVSCKKDYTCECTSTNGSSSSTVSYTFNATKKDAKEACDVYTVSSGTSSTTC